MHACTVYRNIENPNDDERIEDYFTYIASNPCIKNKLTIIGQCFVADLKQFVKIKWC